MKPILSIKILILILFILILIIGGMIAFARKEKNIAGHVVDCETNKPIGEATVSARQRGWGIENGQIVWDKDYISATRTNADGYFAVVFQSKGDAVQLTVEKPLYLRAEQYERSDNKAIRIRMLAGTNALDEPTEECAPASQRSIKVQVVP